MSRELLLQCSSTKLLSLCQYVPRNVEISLIKAMMAPTDFLLAPFNEKSIDNLFQCTNCDYYNVKQLQLQNISWSLQMSASSCSATGNALN